MPAFQAIMLKTQKERFFCEPLFTPGERGEKKDKDA
jgi:hypothetical protein